jgi:hypothetical protein
MRGVSATNNLQHLRTAIEAGSFSNNVLDYGKASGSVYPELVPGTAIKIGQIGLGAFELYQRKKEYKLSYGTAFVEQSAITGSSIALSESLNTVLRACFASSACAVTPSFTAGASAVLGIALDAYRVGQAFKSALDYRHELDLETAAWEEVAKLADRRRLQIENRRKELQQNAYSSHQNTATQGPLKTPRNAANDPARKGPATGPNKSTATATNSKNAGSAGASPTKQLAGTTAKAGAAASSAPVNNETSAATRKSQPAASSGSQPVAQSKPFGSPAVGATAVDVGRPAPLPEVIARPLYSTAPNAPSSATPPTQTNTGSYSQRDILTFARPGGISLSEAAAAAMPIDIDLDGVHYRDGKLLISGRKSTIQVLDAALVLTALRASCEAGDPYFSLDPDNGLAWSIEGDRAFERLWERTKKDLGWDSPVKANERTVNSRSLSVRIIWARRDYPQLWSSITSDYPNLKSRLVFRPAWLQQTRFGEILYKADVLLKELASGVPVLEPGALRATKVDSYVSKLSRSNVKTLFASLRNETVQPQWSGSRLWFDIAPRQVNEDAIRDDLVIGSGPERELFNALKERGFVATNSAAVHPDYQVIREGDTLDLSRVFPTMFVRRHDTSKGVDLPDNDPIMNALSSDVNNNIEKYVGAYKELQSLTGIIRAYIAAVHVVKRDNSICQRLRGLSLFESEKSVHSLPTYHPSELMISVVRYAFGTGRAVRTLSTQGTLIQGGVAIAGKRFYEASAMPARSEIIAELKREVAILPPVEIAKPVWMGDTDRRFILLKLGHEPAEQFSPFQKSPFSAHPVYLGDTLHLPVAPAKTEEKIKREGSPNEIQIENEPPAAQLPLWKKWLQKRN